MRRIVFGVISGFVAWLILWFGSEMAFSALWPNWYGAQQRAFQAAIENGPTASEFKATTSFLLTHIVCASIASLVAGFLAALVAGENKRGPLMLGLALLAVGLLKAILSWPHVPIWYHIAFTAVLLSMTVVGGRLKRAAKRKPD